MGARLRERARDGEPLEELLVEVFALVREVSRRTIGLRHYDVQLIGGMALHDGRIAEMRTGEGKTLVATLAVVLNALSSEGVHLITVNDYLAKRDAAWMAPIYNFLGLSVGVIYPYMPPEERYEAYRADITYGTNSEFGFDYLRDNMVMHAEQMVQRSHAYCIVDEVDSILVDEARTPLIISGPSDDNVELYVKADGVARQLTEGKDYEKDEKERSIAVTEAGIQRCEDLLGMPGLFSDATKSEPGEQRHDDELGGDAGQDGQGAADDEDEVRRGEGQAHPEHDDAQRVAGTRAQRGEDPGQGHGQEEGRQDEGREDRDGRAGRAILPGRLRVALGAGRGGRPGSRDWGIGSRGSHDSVISRSPAAPTDVLTVRSGIGAVRRVRRRRRRFYPRRGRAAPSGGCRRSVPPVRGGGAGREMALREKRS